MFEISDNTTAFKPIAGRQPRRHRATSRLSIAQRTVIAAHLSEHGLSITKAADITCVNTRYVSLVRRMSESERLRLVRGDFSLSWLVNGHRQPTDVKVDRIVDRIGPERIMAALDRVTAPPPTPSEFAAKSLPAPELELTDADSEPADWWVELMNAAPRVAAE